MNCSNIYSCIHLLFQFRETKHWTYVPALNGKAKLLFNKIKCEMEYMIPSKFMCVTKNCRKMKNEVLSCRQLGQYIFRFSMFASTSNQVYIFILMEMSEVFRFPKKFYFFCPSPLHAYLQRHIKHSTFRTTKHSMNFRNYHNLIVQLRQT